ncbi:hypothetical protein E2C01_051632 [Portunus trituberculatus]|uniref:Uncharacterized protein n=1 Tax=Portunus trituberculatus TaxID=210409 RepID=A0A5B7GK39_PORTR|nr:hypothetical protein [Portunus trituberculatus]
MHRSAALITSCTSLSPWKCEQASLQHPPQQPLTGPHSPSQPLTASNSPTFPPQSLQSTPIRLVTAHHLPLIPITFPLLSLSTSTHSTLPPLSPFTSTRLIPITPRPITIYPSQSNHSHVTLPSPPHHGLVIPFSNPIHFSIPSALSVSPKLDPFFPPCLSPVTVQRAFSAAHAPPLSLTVASPPHWTHLPCVVLIPLASVIV